MNTILFDLDGTILDTNEVIIRSWQHAHMKLTGKEKDRQEIVKTFGEPLTLTLANEFPDIPVERSAAIYREYQHGKFEQMVTVFPGMAELIKELYERNYKLGIVTARLRNTTVQGLEKFDLAKYFEAIVSAQDTNKHKPDPTPVFYTLDILKSSPEDAIMIGDSIFDIMCAINAGIPSIFVEWSVTVPEFSKECMPTYKAKTADEILKIITKLNMR